MKVFTAVLGTETNTFSPFLTGMENFERTMLVRNGEHGPKPRTFGLVQVRWREMAEERDWEVVESLAAFAMPAGITLRAVYESLRDEILEDLRAAMPVDMVLLGMHGAMVAEDYDDAEGDLITSVREIVGPDVPIGGELDLHCHLTRRMADDADVLITYKEYPHTDILARAEEVFAITAAASEGSVRPHMSLHDCKMIGVYHASNPQVRELIDQMYGMEAQDGVLSVSLGHGFPWGDVADMGTRVLVVTDNQPAKGDALAASLCERIYAIREEVQPDYRSVDQALDEALAHEGQPVVLADVSDNSGGGAPNDSTFLLRAMLERSVDSAAIGCIWDPVAVSVASEVGEGAELDMRIGGKMGPMSGDPVDLRVRVGKIARDATQPFSDGTVQLGDAVALHAVGEHAGIDIVAISNRTQTFSPDVFTNVGIDPEAKKILVVKSMQHFFAGFEPIASGVAYVAAPGALVPDFTLLPYRKANREIWPLCTPDE